jgi:hypothetical protein
LHKKTARHFHRTAFFNSQRALRLVLATLTTSLCGPLAVPGKVARIMRRSATAVALLSAPAAGLRRALGVMGKVATAVLTADMAGPRRLLAVFGEIARVSSTSLFRHHVSSLANKAIDAALWTGHQLNDVRRGGLSSQYL